MSQTPEEITEQLRQAAEAQAEATRRYTEEMARLAQQEQDQQQ
ncbi:hypothetical protein [Streptomyces achromogenes]